jgi:hypothetical protein
MGRLEGTVSITGLPPHRGLIVHVCLLPTGGPDDPDPRGGPPDDASAVCDRVFEEFDLRREARRPTFERPFAVERPPGRYYVQVRAVVFRSRGGRVSGREERFLFARPVVVAARPAGRVRLPVAWPEEAESADGPGTAGASGRRPWWRIW